MGGVRQDPGRRRPRPGPVWVAPYRWVDPVESCPALGAPAALVVWVSSGLCRPCRDRQLAAWLRLGVFAQQAASMPPAARCEPPRRCVADRTRGCGTIFEAHIKRRRTMRRWRRGQAFGTNGGRAAGVRALSRRPSGPAVRRIALWLRRPPDRWKPGRALRRTGLRGLRAVLRAVLRADPGPCQHTAEVTGRVERHDREPEVDQRWEEMVEASLPVWSTGASLVQWAAAGSWPLNLPRTPTRSGAARPECRPRGTMWSTRANQPRTATCSKSGRPSSPPTES